ncbi:substrate-binding domain-containing protein [Amycolatopsis sp. NPDC059657]|uniref:substrate-binding domain-containing protein n=1 Tax=Amycolatopsis sp. NPDC059657 TaxID=3346899 RepID=UPI00366BF112
MSRKTLSFVAAIVVAAGLIVGLRLITSDGETEGAAGTKCSAADAVKLTVSASPEKAGIVAQIANDYNGRTVAGHCVDVLVQSKPSGTTTQALTRGWNEAADGPRPDVWLPTASSWLTLLKQRLSGTDHPTILAEGETPSVASSPLVIAMPKPMAEALGWPGKGIGWHDLAGLATDPQGWAKYGHPEWGKFRLGKTNPNISTSGLNATIGAYFAATGTSSDLTAADIDKPEVRAFVRSVEQSIVHYGDNTLTFLSNLLAADDRGAAMSYISAVAVDEASLVGYNQGNPTNDPAKAGQHGKPKVPLVAISPSDGTLNSDHPYAVLNWADDIHKQVAADFLATMRGPDAQQKFFALGFRGFDGKTGPQATAENGVDPAAKLNLIRPPGAPVLDKLLASWVELRKKANVLLVVDVSGSMADSVDGTGKNKMELAKQAAVTSLGQFSDADQVGLWSFSTKLDGNRDYRELVPVAPMGPQRATLKSRLEGLIPQGGTGLYDSSLAAYQHIKQHLDPDAINAVVVLTDGRNEDPGGISIDNLIAELHSEGDSDAVRMFTIGYGSDADQEILRRIAQATNASAYDSSKADTIDQVFTAVISNF